MTSDDSLSLILRRIDEIERKLNEVLEELRAPQPSGIRPVGAIFLRRTDGLNEQIFGADQQVPTWGLTD